MYCCMWDSMHFSNSPCLVVRSISISIIGFGAFFFFFFFSGCLPSVQPTTFPPFPSSSFWSRQMRQWEKKPFLSLPLSPSSSSSFFLFCRRHCLCLRRRRRCLDPRTLLQNFISSFLPLSYVFAAAKRKKFLPNFFSFLPFPVNACMSSFQSPEWSSSSSSSQT